jgi:hypothetical protein
MRSKPAGRACRITDNIAAPEYVFGNGDLQKGFYLAGSRGRKHTEVKLLLNDHEYLSIPRCWHRFSSLTIPAQGHPASQLMNS